MNEKVHNSRTSVFNDIYENAPFIVTYKTPSLEIIYCNKVMRDYVGYSSLKEIVGKSDYDFQWAKFADLYKKHETDALKNEVYVAMYPVCNAEKQQTLAIVHRMPYVEFLETMHLGPTSKEQIEATKTMPAANIRILGVTLFGPPLTLKPLLRRFSLLR